MSWCEICKGEVDIYAVDKHHQDCIARVSMPRSYEDRLEEENKRLQESLRQIKRYTYTLDVNYMEIIHNIAESALKESREV